MDLANKDAVRNAIIDAVRKDENPFLLPMSRRQVSDELTYLTYHGFVREYPEGERTRELGPAQGRLFCSWPHSSSHVSL